MRSLVALSRVRGLKLLSSHSAPICYSRTLTSAWIETISPRLSPPGPAVALSRVRGLKLEDKALKLSRTESHSHECVD